MNNKWEKMTNIRYSLSRHEVENAEEWRDIVKKIPSLHFNPKWDVTIIPPFGGAVARFLVRHNKAQVSVYLDWYSQLGWMFDNEENPIPYYEIYPDVDGNNSRYFLGNTEQMMKDIEKSLKGQEKENEESE